MRGEHFFASAQRDWENPPEFDEPEAPTLPDEGICPDCRHDLNWDGEGPEALAYCDTPGCPYDKTKTEAENRRLWEVEQS